MKRCRSLRIVPLLWVFMVSAFVPGKAYAGTERIPVLISDHHADHGLWLLRHSGGEDAVLVVADAHADTVFNPEGAAFQTLFAQGEAAAADSLLKNHNWIHPLCPEPVHSLAWIYSVSGSGDNERLKGFWANMARWSAARAVPVKGVLCINAEETGLIPIIPGPLFVSIDLDLFYTREHGVSDIPAVFNRLLDLSQSWPGPVYWALCVSRAWLPTDEYAWALLEQSLLWMREQGIFEITELTLFTSSRYDTSRTARDFRAAGREPPGLYRRENGAPQSLKNLLKIQRLY
jgi:hypothetical protein